MYLLMDECCPKTLVKLAEKLGHTVQRSIEVASLGQQASDPAIFGFANEAGAIVVTMNRGDFIALAARRPGHPGLIVLPALSPMEVRSHFETILRAVENGTPMTGQVVAIDAAGRLRRMTVPEAPMT